MQDDTSADVTNDVDFDDVDLLTTPLDATSEPAAADTSEEATTEAEDSTDEAAKPDADSEAKDTEATEEATEQTQTDEQQQTEAEKGKPDPELARQAYLERQRTRQVVAQQIDQVYGPKTAEQLYDEAIELGYDPNQAAIESRIQAMQEQIAYSEQRSSIAELNASMQAEAVNAMNDFPMFNEKSPEFDPDFTAMVEQQYRVASRLQADDNGIILNAEVPLYDFYKSMADIYNRGSSRGASKAQAETTETLSRVESVAGGSSTTNKHEETLEEMGERLANMPLI